VPSLTNWKGVDDRDRVGKPVVDGVRVAAERVESGLFDAVDEPLGLRLQQGLVDGAGAADDGVQEAGVPWSSSVPIPRLSRLDVGCRTLDGHRRAELGGDRCRRSG
jgi:hypothetical protein